jgi:hypothetical protein
VSSSSTNKQPLLIDRPLQEFVALGPVAALADPGNFASLIAGGCLELVNCSGDSDGAVIDSVSVVANQSGMTSATVVLFLSYATSALAVNSSNTRAVASVVAASASVGQRTNISLPPMSVPVPGLGGMAAPGETDKKNTGLAIPKGQVLYVGLNQPVMVPTPASTFNVFAQGGYY